MIDSFKEFEKRIYEYCDDNVRKRILFTGFTFLWPQLEQQITPKDLVNLTGKIIHELTEKSVIREVPKPKNSDIPYGMYKILSHKRLIKDNKNKIV